MTRSVDRDKLKILFESSSPQRNFPVKSPRSIWCGQLAFVALILVQSSWLVAQEVTLKREAISIADPKAYQVPLRTVPVKVLEITAPADGIVRQVLVKSGSKVPPQTEACRFDDEVQKLGVDRAKANLVAAKAELKIATEKKDANSEELAKAHITAAEADLKLAELQLEGGVRAERLRIVALPGLATPLLGMDVLGRLRWRQDANGLTFELGGAAR